MARNIFNLYSLTSLVALTLPLVEAGFDATSDTNVAVYWGQNSYGQETSQERLSTYCSNTNIDIIPIGFLTGITTLQLNFANAGNNCTVFAGTQLFSCPQLEEDIQTCQSQYGKTIVLSIGGATYTEGGFTSPTAAVAAAKNVWLTFGPKRSCSRVNRPFGNAVVDGFDFDFESATQNTAPFANELRTQMDTATAGGDKAYYLSAAPQCPYPDVADNDMLDGAVKFDFIMIQFYNNYCGVANFIPGAATQSAFNFDTWDEWAHTVSLNPNVKVLLGIPANVGAGAGYTDGAQLDAAIQYSKKYSSFGGAMLWDMSQLYKNPGFLEEVVGDLDSGAPVTSTSSVSTTSTSKTATTTSSGTTLSTSTKTVTTTSTSTSPVPTGSLVPQWGQCGGKDYTGPTVCAPPWTCQYLNEYWSSCH